MTPIITQIRRISKHGRPHALVTIIEVQLCGFPFLESGERSIMDLVRAMINGFSKSGQSHVAFFFTFIGFQPGIYASFVVFHFLETDGGSFPGSSYINCVTHYYIYIGDFSMKC